MERSDGRGQNGVGKDQRARNRAERIARAAAEREAARRAIRRRRIVGGAAAGVLAVGVAGALLLGAAGGGDRPGRDDTGFDAVAIPVARTTALSTAVRVAGCRLRSDDGLGSEHTTELVNYEASLPTSGSHNPSPAEDRAYLPPDAPTVEQSVHSLEHGRIAIQWRPGLLKRDVDQLYSVFRERDGYHALLFENQTGMKAAVAATAWQNALVCPRVDERTLDAVRAFRTAFTDKGPELVP